MGNAVSIIPYTSLAAALVPVAVVVAILFRWSLGARSSIYAMLRMLLQLIAVGYVLAFLFESDSAVLVSGVLGVMLFAAGWIAMRPVRNRVPGTFPRALAAIAVGGIPTLGIITEVVLDMPRWFEPHVVIPLAGMVFANAMNTVSLAAERFESERGRGVEPAAARGEAMNAALIPVVNALLAAGIVSLPGMMTGQILSGVDPLVAVRYQIMVMAMIFGASGIAAAVYLVLAARQNRE